MIFEALFLCLLYALGAAVLRTAGGSRPLALCLGFFAGLPLHLLVSSLLMMAGIYAFWPALAATAAAGAMLILFCGRSTGPVQLDRGFLVSLVLASAATAILAAGLRAAGMVSWHTDSLTYALMSSLIYTGEMGEISASFFMLRYPAVLMLHAPAQAIGEYYLKAITPLISVFSLVATGFLAWRLAAKSPSATAAVLAISLATALALTTNRYVWHSFYLNGHLLFGSLFLVVAASAAAIILCRKERALPFFILIALCAPLLILTRVEGALATGLALVPLLAATGPDRRGKCVVLVACGLALLAVQGFILSQHGFEGRGTTYALMAIGGACLLAAPAALAIPGIPRPRWAMFGAFAILCAALAALIVLDRDTAYLTWQAMRHNLGGEGSWGYSLYVFAGLVVLALVLSRDEAVSWLWFPLMSTGLLFVLLSFVRRTPFRIGEGDSLNRMAVQLLPLAALLIAIGLASGRTRLPSFSRRSFRGRLQSPRQRRS